MAVESKVKDASLSGQGRQKISWAESRMPVLMQVRERFSKEKPLKGLRIACCLHVTKETAVLAETLKAGGASVVVCGSNPLSTQDDVAAALAEGGLSVFAWRGQNREEYYWCLNKALDSKPQITMDDGADLINAIHGARRDLLKEIIGGQEETTTGVIRLRAMAKDGKLEYPVVAVNDTPTKHLFDNFHGTSQSTLDALMRTCNLLIAGSVFVVGGYGHCGRGLALRARGMGARVIVTEVDAVKALEAAMQGFEVMPMVEAAKIGDVFVTVTGCKEIIRGEHAKLMKDKAILANSGHFNVEISVDEFEKIKKGKKTIKPNLEEYELQNGKRVYLVAEGRLCNLAAAEGHPPEVMDLSFSDQALCSEHLAKNARKMQKGVHEVPKEIDDQVASLKLKAMNIKHDALSKSQLDYLNNWREGT